VGVLVAAGLADVMAAQSDVLWLAPGTSGGVAGDCRQRYNVGGDEITADGDDARSVTLFLCGDVTTGRGIDHILAHPSDPRLFEPYVKDAGEYVTLAEAVNGPVPRAARDAYMWGDALAELAHRESQIRIANLETSITRSPEPWPGKGIHYRMNPANAGCLAVARLDACALANNHVLDFGFPGLRETLDGARSGDGTSRSCRFIGATTGATTSGRRTGGVRTG
jgi:hypothetical protein